MTDRLSEIRAAFAGEAWNRLGDDPRARLMTEVKRAASAIDGFAALPCADQDRMLRQVARARAFDALPEADRLDLVRQAGLPPEACGPELPVSPAAGGYRVFDVLQAYPDGEDGTVLRPGGFQGRKTAARADAFDRMRAQAERRRAVAPFTAEQVHAGRRYAALAQYVDGGAMKGSWPSGGGHGGSQEGFTDHRLMLSRDLERIRKRIGPGVVLSIRRIRPSARASGAARRPITDRALVDQVCLNEMTISEALAAHGWSVKSDHIGAAMRALAQALDRMLGPGPMRGVVALHVGPKAKWNIGD